MEYVSLGNSGMDVSKICLGCMGFGDPAVWLHPWLINVEESRKVIQHALEVGINFFDTANVCSFGISEHYLGRALKDFAKREDIVIATKVSVTMREGKTNGTGLSRKEIFYECEQSLKNLQTNYIDLYIIQRWDYNTPIEETICALNDLVRSGKVRYIGFSAMHAWQFQKAQHVAEKNGWTKFISMQKHYNLIFHEEEREMNLLCAETGVASTPCSPLAGGTLTRTPGDKSLRGETDKVQMKKYGTMVEQDRIIIERVAELAEKKGILKSLIALAWLWTKSPVVAPIVGATKFSHIDDAVGTLDVKLSAEEITYLEESYGPHPIGGLSEEVKIKNLEIEVNPKKSTLNKKMSAVCL